MSIGVRESACHASRYVQGPLPIHPLGDTERISISIDRTLIYLCKELRVT